MRERVDCDGCVIRRLGKYVAEKEQRAFIEWQAGQERLYVATRTEASTEPTLWVLPIPGRPENVRAEPVERFPHVSYARSALARARLALQEAMETAILLDTGGVLLAPCLFAGFGGKGGRPPDRGIEVYQRVEKLGMIVEVLTTKSVAALDAYLADKNLGIRAIDISALAPYLGQDYALICGWSTTPGKEIEARALRIDFPSPVIFYPLRPTQVYEGDVPTAIYVRAWVQPQDRMNLPGLHCQHQYGQVSFETVDAKQPHRSEPGNLEPVTRANLHPIARGWTQDLMLEPGAPRALEVAEVIEDLSRSSLAYFLQTSLLGMLLACALPFLVIGREQRGTDWIWALSVGAALCMSIFGSALFFFSWRATRRSWNGSVLDASEQIGLWGLCTFLVGAPLLVSDGRLLGEDSLVLALIVVVCGLLLLLGLVILVGWHRGGWLLAFGAGHLLIVVSLAGGLDLWLSYYE